MTGYYPFEYEKNAVFYLSLSNVLPNQKNGRCGLVHLVEQVFLYKTLSMAILWNSIFPNLFITQVYEAVCLMIEGRNTDENIICYSQNVAQLTSNRMVYKQSPLRFV